MNEIDSKNSENNALKLYKNQDVAGKKYTMKLFTPTSFDPVTKK